MDITTPALLFPAISLLFVAYTNRLHSLSVLIRAMTTEGSDESKTKQADEQLNILEKRVIYIRRMQVFGVISFIFNLMTIILVYLKYYILGNYIFGFGLLMLSGSLLFALLETLISTKALDIHLKNSRNKSFFPMLSAIKQTISNIIELATCAVI